MLFLPDFSEQVEQYVTISRLNNLFTRTLKVKRVAFLGFTGTVTFDIHRQASPDLVYQLNLLADFAMFCGTGKKTAMGMGQTYRDRRDHSAKPHAAST